MTKNEMRKALLQTTAAEKDILECIMLGTDEFKQTNYDVNHLADLGLVCWREGDPWQGVGCWGFCGGKMSEAFEVLNEFEV